VIPEEGEWFAIALVGKPRGNRGELTAVSLSDQPERFATLKEVYVFLPGKPGGERLAVESTWFHDGRLISSSPASILSITPSDSPALKCGSRSTSAPRRSRGRTSNRI
jgi:hypothetical protein